MEKLIHSVLLEFEHLVLLTLVIGLLISAFVRLIEPRAQISEKGFAKINVDRFGGVDLVAVALLVAFYYSVVLFGVQPKEARVVLIEHLAAGVVLNLFLATIVLVTVQWVGGRNTIELFGLNRISFFKCLLWAIIGVLMATPLVLLLAEWLRSEWLEPIFGKMKEQDVVGQMKGSSSMTLKIGMIVSVCVVAPVVEELIFRGYIYGVLKRFSNPLFATIIVSALFAVVHLNLPALLPLWVFAVILTLAYEWSGSLWVPIGIHAGFNTFSVVAMLSGGEAAP